MKRIVPMVAFALAVMPAASQTPAQKPSFEVASIKLNTSGDDRVSVDAAMGRFAATNVSLRILVRYAYDRRLPEDEMRRAAFLFSSTAALQIIGGPGWMNNDRFDIEAKPPQDHPVTQVQMQSMMQALLEDRFQLKTHREMREVPTYNLTIVKEGKMKVSGESLPASVTAQGEKLPPMPRGRISTFVIGKPRRPLVMTMFGNAIPISTLIPQLESAAGRPITDKTNLKELYDVLLQFSPEQSANSLAPPDATQTSPPSDPSGPSIFTAIQQELGLRLEPSKGSVEVLVIDSVQRPSEN
jgi:uncharacterized protein (TIGR03435 family)